MPAKPSELQAAVLQWQTRSRIMGDSAAAGMHESYKVILEQLEPRLQALQARIKAKQDAGEEFSKAWLFQEQRYLRMIQETRTLVGQYAAFAQQNMTNQQKAAVMAAYQAGVQQMALVGVGGSDPAAAAGFAGINEAAATNLVGALQADTPLGGLFDSLADEGVEALKTALVTSFGLGLGIDDIVRDMRKALAIPGYRAERIARTEILRATNEGLRDSFIKSGVVKKWRWSAALSAGTCPACLQQHGKIFPLTTPMQRHVQCRCSMSPYLDDGTDANWLDGDTWLRAQDDAIQDAILTKQGGAAFRAGKVGLPDFSYLRTNAKWGDSFQKRSWSSVAKHKGLPVDYIGFTSPGGAQGATAATPAKAAPPAPAPGSPAAILAQSAYTQPLQVLRDNQAKMAQAAADKGSLALSPAERAKADADYKKYGQWIRNGVNGLVKSTGVSVDDVAAALGSSIGMPPAKGAKPAGAAKPTAPKPAAAPKATPPVVKPTPAPSAPAPKVTETKPAAATGWKPSMTKAEADTWSKGTAKGTERVWLHGTGTKAAATAISKDGFDLSRKANGRMYGNGVYMTNKGQTTAAYAYGDTPTVLELRVRSFKPIDSQKLFDSPEYDRAYTEANTWYSAQMDKVNRGGWQGKFLDQEIAKIRADPRADANAYAVDQALKAFGGDAITVKISDDEDWIIIPDPQNVTVVGSGAVKSYEDKYT